MRDVPLLPPHDRRMLHADIRLEVSGAPCIWEVPGPNRGLPGFRQPPPVRHDIIHHPDKRHKDIDR